jgi:hypothetical protein
MIKNIIKLLTLLDNKINLVKTDTGGMRIIQVENNVSGKFRIFTISNPGLKESKDLIKALFVTLNKDIRFTDYCDNKILITAAIINGQEYSFHYNVLIDSLTTFNDYWDSVKNHLKANFGHSYGVSVIPMFKVRVWNGDDLKNKHIKRTRVARGVQGGDEKIVNSILKYSNIAASLYSSTKFNLVNRDIVRCYVNPQFVRSMSTKTTVKKEAPSIKPYSDKRLKYLAKSSTRKFGASDLETMEVNGVQVPVLLTYVNDFETKYFMIDSVIMTDGSISSVIITESVSV